MNARSAWTLALVLFSSGALAAAPDPTKPPAEGQKVDGEESGKRFARPDSQPPVLPQGPVAGRAAPPSTSKRLAAHGAYQTLRALQIKEGEALVQTAEGQRLLHPGDHIGNDVVKAIDEGLLVLDRPAAPGQPGGDRRIVVRFDAQGRASVRIYTTEDPTAVELQRVH